MRTPLNVISMAIAVAMALVTAHGQAPAAVTSPRLYVFDGGSIRGLDTKLFGFERNEIGEPDFTVASYLVVHPRGTLMFDSGAIPDGQFKADGSPVVEGVVTATKPLLPQLAAAGYRPSDITYFAMSHYHSDHTANANAFRGATWIVQREERDVMFGTQQVGIMQRAHFSALRDAKAIVLENADLDVFGDGSVVVMSAPGHTPGHQVLLLRTKIAGPILLTGDLYHYPEERATGKTPTFEFNPEQSKVTRARLEAFATANNAKLWIEHDIATHAPLPKPPAFVD